MLNLWKKETIREGFPLLFGFLEDSNESQNVLSFFLSNVNVASIRDLSSYFVPPFAFSSQIVRNCEIVIFLWKLY